MIRDIVRSSQHIMLTTQTQPYVTQAGNNQYSGLAPGQMRFNLLSQNIEVFDGMSWIDISTIAHVGVSTSAEEAINWTIKKMDEEKALAKKMEEHPTLKDAYEQYKTIEALVYEHEANE